MFKLDDCVYYTDNGPHDTGTVTEVDEQSNRYRVRWHDGFDERDWYMREQLSKVD